MKKEIDKEMVAWYKKNMGSLYKEQINKEFRGLIVLSSIFITVFILINDITVRFVLGIGLFLFVLIFVRSILYYLKKLNEFGEINADLDMSQVQEN